MATAWVIAPSDSSWSTTLCLPVAFKNRSAESNLQEAQDLLGNGGRTSYEKTDPPAEYRLELVKNQCVVDLICGVSVVLKVVELLLDAPIGYSALPSGQFVDLLLHHVVESIIEPRHANHQCRF